MFCRCAGCQRARELGGKNIRTRSSLQLGSEYKVDFPPDSYSQMLGYGLRFSELKHLFITHGHQDHLYGLDLKMRSAPFAITPLEELCVYGTETVCEQVKEAVRDPEACRLSARVVRPFESFTAGELLVTPILANHDPDLICLNYIFQLEGKTLLQGFDTGWYQEATWEKLSDYRLELVIMDCTGGGLEGETHPRGHLGVKSLLEVKHKMEKRGMLAFGCLFVATHFCHGGRLLHHELGARLNPRGIEVAYDGMKLEI